MTRGKTVHPEDLHALIRGLEIPESEKERLLEMTPATYVGKAAGPKAINGTAKCGNASASWSAVKTN